MSRASFLHVKRFGSLALWRNLKVVNLSRCCSKSLYSCYTKFPTSSMYLINNNVIPGGAKYSAGCFSLLIRPVYLLGNTMFTGAPMKSEITISLLDEKQYNELADKTLDSLTASFEDLSENMQCDPDFDVILSSGVLTVKICSGKTFVINKQTPNRQIWVSSPLSGPKRFDFVNSSWIYLQDGTCLHNLLSDEVSELLKQPVSFADCAYA